MSRAQTSPIGRFLRRLPIAHLIAAATDDELVERFPDDTEDRRIGPELRMQVHFWRGEALARLGETARASAERAAARSLAQGVRDLLPERYRNQFASRVDVRPVLRDGAAPPVTAGAPNR